MRDLEHQIQCASFKAFSYYYPQYRGLLFAVPNGGQRNAIVAAKMKAEGVTPGVADILFLVPRQNYHGLCIEFKTTKGRQQDTQKEWQKKVEAEGYRYVIVRSTEEFINTINEYLE